MVNGDDGFLPNKAADEVYLYGRDRTREPKHSKAFEEWVDDFGHGALETKLVYVGADDSVELDLVHFYHGDSYGIHLCIVFEISFGYAGYFFGDLLVCEGGNFGYFDAIFVE